MKTLIESGVLEYVKKWALIILLLVVLIGEIVFIFKLNREYEWYSRKIVKYSKLLDNKKKELNKLRAELIHLAAFEQRIKSFPSEALAFAYIQGKLSKLAKKSSVNLRNVSILKTSPLKSGIYSTYISVYLYGSPYGVLKFLSDTERLTDIDTFTIEKCIIRVLAYRSYKKKYKFSMKSDFVIKVVWLKEEGSEG